MVDAPLAPRRSAHAEGRPKDTGHRCRKARHGDMVLAHHLGRTRKGAPIPNLPPLAQRIVACGSLARPWALVAQAKGVPNAPTTFAARVT
jgi:hypothetical protein